MRQIGWAHIELFAPGFSAKTACNAYEILITPATDIIPAEVREDNTEFEPRGPWGQSGDFYHRQYLVLVYDIINIFKTRGAEKNEAGITNQNPT
jgi:hypothetical protein